MAYLWEVTTKRLILLVVCCAIGAAFPTGDAFANEDGGVFDEDPFLNIGKDPKPKKPKKVKKPKKKGDAKAQWANNYQHSSDPTINAEQDKLRKAVVESDLKGAVIDPKAKRTDIEKRYKPLFTFMTTYDTLEARAKTQAQKKELAKLWGQLTKYGNALIYRDVSAVARGMKLSFEVRRFRGYAADKKKILDKLKAEKPTPHGKIFLAQNDFNLANRRFEAERNKLPKPMRGAFPDL